MRGSILIPVIFLVSTGSFVSLPALVIFRVQAMGATLQVNIFDCTGSNCNPTGGGYGFNPHVLNITTGTVVVWTNTGVFAHTTTDQASSPYWDSGTISPGGSFGWNFTRHGVYSYMCSIHPFMTAVVNATGPDLPPSSSQPPPSQPPPSPPPPSGSSGGQVLGLPSALGYAVLVGVVVAVVVGGLLLVRRGRFRR